MKKSRNEPLSFLRRDSIRIFEYSNGKKLASKKDKKRKLGTDFDSLFFKSDHFFFKTKSPETVSDRRSRFFH
ncbi:hypothetical protein [Leptospira santarosai]|uniref:hypothetical protein n=1 Tax=Leptospira santarosai TaxID=28183 RepID=UPI0002DC1F5A|nr:hypothetical protein [Leptospira santarosai]MDI7189412.1 hypothetical protein [Leptospira santarosai]MDI7221561.1 hypothetical protein [Leptospira santarosai]